MDNGLEGSKFLDFAQSVSERRRFRGCGVSLGRLGFAGGLGVMEAASAGSLGPAGRFRFWDSNYNTGFSFKWVIFARLKKAIWGCGVGLRRLGFAGGLGVMEAASAGSLGPIGRFRFWESNYNTGFSFKRVIFARLQKAIWGCGVGLGPLGVAGGLVRGSTASLGPIGRFRFGRQINTVFSFKWPFW